MDIPSPFSLGSSGSWPINIGEWEHLYLYSVLHRPLPLISSSSSTSWPASSHTVNRDHFRCDDNSTRNVIGLKFLLPGNCFILCEDDGVHRMKRKSLFSSARGHWQQVIKIYFPHTHQPSTENNWPDLRTSPWEQLVGMKDAILQYLW